MSDMLPSGADSGPRLGDVLTSSLAALRGRPNPLGLRPMRRAVVVLVDGLGADALRARAGHARHLTAALVRRATIRSGFPTTTAAALASLGTGLAPGRHGFVGYSMLDPGRDRVVGLLNGWDAGRRPEEEQPEPTVFETARDDGVRSVVVGPGRYADSGFTRAVLRGAEHVAGERIADRFDALARILRRPERALIYLYVPELDAAAHAHGSASNAWTVALEELDSALGGFLPSLASDTGLLVTADHGIVDVPAAGHRYLGDTPGLLDGVRHIAGEPRCLQLHLEPGVDARVVQDRLGSALRDEAWVAMRDDAVAADWFGEVTPHVLPRIGDVLVAARGPVAFYADRASPGVRMVGQHGSWSEAELRVPLLRYGAAVR